MSYNDIDETTQQDPFYQRPGRVFLCAVNDGGHVGRIFIDDAGIFRLQT